MSQKLTLYIFFIEKLKINFFIKELKIISVFFNQGFISDFNISFLNEFLIFFRFYCFINIINFNE